MTATASDPALSVEIAQAGSVPGTAVVRVIDYITGDEADYYLNFGTKAYPDEFKTLVNWDVIREDKTAWALQDGALTIETGEGDVTLANNNARNIFVQSANTDWTAETKLTTSAVPGSPSQNAGLIAYGDDDNFVKLVYGSPAFGRGMAMPTPGAAPAGSIQLIAEEGGNNKSTVSVSLAGIPVKDNTVWLRLVRAGSLYTAYYSIDGKKFTKVGEASVLLKDIRAGLIACDGVRPSMGGRGMAMPMMPTAAPAATPAPLKVAFDWFHIK